MSEIELTAKSIHEVTPQNIIISLYNVDVGTTKINLPIVGIYNKLLKTLVSPDVSNLLPLTFIVNSKDCCSNFRTAKEQSKIILERNRRKCK